MIVNDEMLLWDILRKCPKNCQDSEDNPRKPQNMMILDLILVCHPKLREGIRKQSSEF
jgi:hypothetical protein